MFLSSLIFLLSLFIFFIISSSKKNNGESMDAYRADRSIETALYQLTELIQASLDSRETAICAFMDIAGAFDNIPHKVVKRSLGTRGV